MTTSASIIIKVAWKKLVNWKKSLEKSKCKGKKSLEKRQWKSDSLCIILINTIKISEFCIKFMHKNSKNLYYYSKSSGLEIDFVSKIGGKTMLIEVKVKDGNSKAYKTILNNSEYKVDGLIKLSSKNIE